MKHEFDLVTQSSELSSLRVEWDELFKSTTNASPFNSHLWTQAWAECFIGGDDARVLLLRSQGKLLGIAPLFIRCRYGLRVMHLLGMKQVHGESTGFLISEPYENDVGGQLLDALMDLDRPWDAVSFYGIRMSSSLHRLLMNCDSRFGAETRCITTHLGRAYVLNLEETWQRHLHGCSRNFRRNYKRQSHRGQMNGIDMQIETDFPGHDDLVDRLIQVESLSWQGSNSVALIKSNELFFRNVIPSLLARGWLEVAWALKDGIPRAFVSALVHGERAYVYETAYDANMFNLSLGNLVHYRLLQRMCERGIRVADFMTDIGENRYKERWTPLFETSL
jgi:CelD/BcsL family acetyltransferase involved in cellulose biosynthesis